MTPSSISKLEHILTGIIAVLVMLLFLGTIAGIAKKSFKNDAAAADSKTAQKLISAGKAENLTLPQEDDVTGYYELGQIRLVTAAESGKKSGEKKGSVMVIKPWLSYPKSDSVFYEELDRKKAVLKGIFTAYFSTRTKNEILKKSEEKVCQELLERINSELALGKISAINFTDYIFFD